MMDVQEAIQNAPVFAHLTKKDIKQLAAVLTARSFPAGTVVIEQGTPGVGFFLIASGSAAVTVGGRPKNVMGAGEHFGEIALIDDGLRAGEVTAETDLECYAMAAWQFRPFVQDHPDVAWALLRSLVQRIVRDDVPGAGSVIRLRLPWLTRAAPSRTAPGAAPVRGSGARMAPGWFPHLPPGQGRPIPSPAMVSRPG